MKYSVGEVCLGRHPDGSWQEVTIIAIGKFFDQNKKVAPYQVDAPNHPDSDCNTISAFEHDLRKKHPPQQDTQIAEDWFIQDFNKIFETDEVKV